MAEYYSILMVCTELYNSCGVGLDRVGEIWKMKLYSVLLINMTMLIHSSLGMSTLYSIRIKFIFGIKPSFSSRVVWWEVCWTVHKLYSYCHMVVLPKCW